MRFFYPLLFSLFFSLSVAWADDSTTNTIEGETKIIEADYKNICGRFFILKKSFFIINRFDFNSNEKKLICGSDEPGWKNIPQWQSEKNLKVFLNDRGYFNSKFRTLDGKTYVNPNEKSQITRLEFIGAEKILKTNNFLGISDSVLNSESLDEIKAWAISRLKVLGYPCPSLSIEADPRNGKVTLNVTPNEKVKIRKINREAPDGVRPFALSRYDAFKVGDFYNGNNFSLTSRRLLASGIADYTDFDTFCEKKDNDGIFKQRLTYSKPESLVLAVGGTTEQFPVLKGSWKHSRLDQNASQAQLTLFLSPVEQSINAFSHWHLFNNLPRLYFLPTASVARIDEIVYTSVVQNLGFGLGYMYDDSSRSLRIETKPTYNIENRQDGEGPKDVKYLSLESSLSVYNHEFEFNQQSPIAGYQVDLNWSFRNKGLGSDISGNRYSLEGTFLHNWGGFDPPLFVLGFRFKYETLITPDLFNLPSRFRLFLGGDRDIRGFSRKSINNSDLGFFTTAYLGAELRLLRVLPFELQPFAFFDIAKLGLQSFELDEGVLLSPGLGLRWQSPIGAVRTTAAKGIASQAVKDRFDLSSDWTFFISLGQEF